MIAKKYRVPKEQIPYLLKKGQQSESRLFIFRYAKNNEHFSRFRVIISRKLSSKAVERNRLRRQIYEAIRLQEEKRAENIDFILIPKKKILSNNYREIAQDLKTIL